MARVGERGRVRRFGIPEWARAADGLIEETRAARGIPGMSVAVAEHGVEMHARGFGMRDRERAEPATPDTIYGIGGITKAFTCVAILQLAERRKLALEDPLSRYLPEFRTPDPAHARHVTLHHLMTHTSGLPPLPLLWSAMARSAAGDPAAASFAAQPCAPIDTYEELMDCIAGLDFELVGAPGEHFSYSNEAYGLLGCIIERVSGMSYEDYVASRILRPLGMSRTFFDAGALAGRDDVATLYARRNPSDGPGADEDADGAGPGAASAPEVFPAPMWWHAPAMLSAGFLKSTVRDMLRFVDIFRTGGVGAAQVGRPRDHARTGAGHRILSGESVRRMTHPHVALQPGTAYGYGLVVRRGYHGVTILEHSGGLKGIAASFEVVPQVGITAVELANLMHPGPGFAAHAVVNSALGLPLETPLGEPMPEVACPPASSAATRTG